MDTRLALPIDFCRGKSRPGNWCEVMTIRFSLVFIMNRPLASWPVIDFFGRLDWTVHVLDLSKSDGTVYDSAVRRVVSVALDEKHSHLRCLQECKKTRTLYAAKKSTITKKNCNPTSCVAQRQKLKLCRELCFTFCLAYAHIGVLVYFIC